ncbi:MAG: RrF2 family transcriptional regulator [Planctomycetota bacterium]|nr:Rrf2 family transcriptional regulator [Planctomycetota bacterium]
MRLSAKTEYAALAVVELARRIDSPTPVRIREICTAQGVPPRFLVHILLQLKAAGIVMSVRGAAGGYRLAKAPGEVTLLDVLEAVDGPADAAAPLSAELSRKSRTAATLVSAWETVAEAESKALAAISIASLAAKCGPPGDSMYYI